MCPHARREIDVYSSIPVLSYMFWNSKLPVPSALGLQNQGFRVNFGYIWADFSPVSFNVKSHKSLFLAWQFEVVVTARSDDRLDHTCLHGKDVIQLVWRVFPVTLFAQLIQVVQFEWALRREP